MSLHVGMIGAGAIADDHCTVVQKILDGIYASSASGKEVRIR